MSSPCTVVVIITGFGSDRELVDAAQDEHAKWLSTLNPERMFYTNSALDNFFETVKSSKGYIDGPEGGIVTWGYCGNYFNTDDFLQGIKGLVARRDRCCSYTVMVNFYCDNVYVLKSVRDSGEFLPETPSGADAMPGWSNAEFSFSLERCRK